MAEEKIKKSNRVVKYFKDLKSELKKIVWSPKKDVIKNTTVVIITVAIAAVVVVGLDSAFTGLLNLLAGLFD